MQTPKIYDVSLPLHSGLPVWQGDPPAVIEQISSIEKGDLTNCSRIASSLHWGTHIDAPFHLYSDCRTIEQIPLEVLIGPARVIEIKDALQVTSADLMGFNLTGVQRLLIKTRNSKFWGEDPLIFHQDFTALTPDAAEHLLKIGVKLIGIDYFSIDLFDAENLPVHRILYRQNIVGIEALDLRGISPGDYQLICLPLKILQGDGAPARVVLKNVIE